MEENINGLTIVDGAVVKYDYTRADREVVVPRGVTAIAERAFALSLSHKYKTKLRSVILPDGLVSIGARAFTGSTVSSIVVPPSVETIGEYAFNFTDIAKITLPAGLKRLECGLFNCSKLKSFVVPDGVEFISKLAFIACKQLRKVYIPSTVKTIEFTPFYGCETMGEHPLVLYVSGEPQPGWCDEKETVTRQGDIVTPEDDAFNFHRSSGSFTSHSYEYEVTVIKAWYTDGEGHSFKVCKNTPREVFDKA